MWSVPNQSHKGLISVSISAVKRLITSKIKVFIYIIYVYCVYLLCINKYTHIQYIF